MDQNALGLFFSISSTVPVTKTPFLIGASHRSASLTLRDRLFTEDGEVPGMLARLKQAGLTEVLWFATCDRVEVVGCAEDPTGAALQAAEVLAARAELPLDEVAGELVTLTGQAAVRHLFSVAASLDSQVVGEPYVLGQVKAAYRAAEFAGTAGQTLTALLHAAFGAAKRVRTETAIGAHPTSVAAAAVQTARELHGDLRACRVLLVGLADMGVLMVEEMRAAGIGPISVAAPNDARAEALARRLGTHAVRFAGLDAALVHADIVVSAASLGRFLLTPQLLQGALRRRRQRPIFVVDAGVPADVDPGVEDLAHAFVFDLDDLERVALTGRVKREAEAEAAWAIVDEAVTQFLKARAERHAVPAVVALRTRFESERERLLSERNDLDAAEATRLLINRLLHRPSAMLRELASAPEAAGLPERLVAERLLSRLFGLDADEGGERMTRAGDAMLTEKACPPTDPKL